MIKKKSRYKGNVYRKWCDTSATGGENPIMSMLRVYKIVSRLKQM